MLQRSNTLVSLRMLLITYSQVRMTNDLSTICKPIQTEVYLYITCIRIGKYNHRDHVASNAFKTYECLFTPEWERVRERVMYG